MATKAAVVEELIVEESMGLYDIVRTLEDPKLSNYELGHLVVEFVLEMDKTEAHGFLDNLIAGEIRRIRRHMTLQCEEEMDSELKSGVDPSEAIKRTIKKSFWIPSEGSIPWATATVPQHTERIQYQERQMVPLKRDIARHRHAIKSIQDGGVTCLAELGDKK